MANWAANFLWHCKNVKILNNSHWVNFNQQEAEDFWNENSINPIIASLIPHLMVQKDVTDLGTVSGTRCSK